MNEIILSAVGFLSGITASMGIGGGFVLLLYLTAVAAVPQKEAQLINLIFFLPIAVIAIILHIKNKLIDVKSIIPAVIGGFAGVFAGVWAANILSNEIISKLFAAFIFLIGIKELFFKSESKKTSAADSRLCTDLIYSSANHDGNVV